MLYRKRYFRAQKRKPRAGITSLSAAFSEDDDRTLEDVVGFGGIITNRAIGFNSSPFAAVDNAYPGTFEKEQFSRYREVVYLEKRGFRKAWKV